MPHPFNKRRTSAGRLGLLVVLCLGLAGAAAGQGNDQARVYYFNERSFEIPFDMGNRPVVKVMLHAAAEGKPYSQVATAQPDARRFIYNASADGWYSFVVQVQDKNNQLTPANVGQGPPHLRVCVDTEKPVISVFKPVIPQGGTTAVEWQVNDRNLDLGTLRLAYRPAGKGSWTTLNIRQLRHAQFSWTPRAAGNYEVQLSVADQAGNTAAQTIQVRAAAGNPGEVTQAGGVLSPKVRHVRSKTFRLNYTIDNVGPSKVKHVEVWMTRDTKLWSRYKGDAPPGGTYELTVESAGRYGFTLRPCSGVGRAPRPPDVGEQPQLWIQVDETKPEVRIHSVSVGEKEDLGTFTVSYTARDAHLRSKPISLFYSASKEGPWTQLLADQENTGSLKCSTKDLPFEFFLRLEAIDEAGNKGFGQWRETVKVDLNVPVIKEISADPVEGAAGPSP
jgi:hypothetical protein